MMTIEYEGKKADKHALVKFKGETASRIWIKGHTWTQRQRYTEGREKERERGEKGVASCDKPLSLICAYLYSAPPDNTTCMNHNMYNRE